MVICTFISAPIMYVSAWLVTISWNDPQFVMNSVQNVSVDVSIVGLVGLVSRSCTFYYLFKKKKRLTEPICLV